MCTCSKKAVLTFSRIRAMQALQHIFKNFIFLSKVYKYSRVNQSVVYHVSCLSSGSDGIQTEGLTEEHKPLRFTLAHSHARLRIEKSSGSLLFCLLVCLSLALSSSLCTHSCSSITPFLCPTLFFFYHSEPFGWNETICRKYAHIVYRAYFNTYVGLCLGRERARLFLSNIFLNLLQLQCAGWLMTNVLYHSRIAE